METQFVMWEWMAFMPDIRLARVGVDTGQAYAWVKIAPCCARRSMLGV